MMMSTDFISAINVYKDQTGIKEIIRTTSAMSDYADTHFIIYDCMLITETKHKYIIRDNSYLSIQAHAEVLGHAPRQYLMYTSVHKYFLFVIQHI
jgi:hypothetical protein